jgi:hypothetical protein
MRHCEQWGDDLLLHALLRTNTAVDGTWPTFRNTLPDQNPTFTMACAASLPDRMAPSIDARYFCFVKSPARYSRGMGLFCSGRAACGAWRPRQSLVLHVRPQRPQLRAGPLPRHPLRLAASQAPHV